MKTTVECAKITVQVPKENYQSLTNILKEIGILYYYNHSSRIVALQEKEAFLFLPAKIDLYETNLEIVKFYTPKEHQKRVISAIAKELKLNIHGNGSIYGESVEAIYDDAIDIINSKSIDQKALSDNGVLLGEHLWSVSCILQRGEADQVVKAALDLGVGIPSVTYGVGTGFRNKLGLLRITVPAEKEVVSLVVNKSNVKELMNTLIAVGELDKPGKGFIYSYPLGLGVINSKMFYGKQRHLATMEQVISAIDSLKNDTTWRLRESGQIIHNYKMLSELVGMNMYANEGLGSDLVDLAMDAESVGATISLGRLKQDESCEVRVSNSQEIATMIVGYDKIEHIVDVVEKGGLFANYGMIELKSVEEACTYLG